MNFVHRISFLDVFSMLSYEIVMNWLFLIWIIFQDCNAHMIIFIEYAQYK